MKFVCNKDLKKRFLVGSILCATNGIFSNILPEINLTGSVFFFSSVEKMAEFGPFQYLENQESKEVHRPNDDTKLHGLTSIVNL